MDSKDDSKNYKINPTGKCIQQILALSIMSFFITVAATIEDDKLKVPFRQCIYSDDPGFGIFSIFLFPKIGKT